MFNTPFINKAIDNCGPYVDTIYVWYSKYPIYNREKWITNPTPRENLDRNLWEHKIQIVDWDWLNETVQRNDILEYALKDWCTHLIVQDADEFYLDRDYEALVKYIREHPEYDWYTCSMLNFRKRYRVKDVDYGDQVDICMNIEKGVRFNNARLNTAKHKISLLMSFYHLWYCLNDEEMLVKIRTRWHHNEFDVIRWYNTTRLPFTLESTNLHPVSPSVRQWVKKWEWEIPNVLIDLFKNNAWI